MSEWDKMIRASSNLGFADAEASQTDAGRTGEGEPFSLQTVGALFGLDGEEPMETLTLGLGYKRSA